MELLLIRHGLPVRHEALDGAQPDPALSTTGLAQAEALADWLATERIDAVYSSPMQRAFQTAEPLARARGLRLVIDDDLRELTFGESIYIPLEDPEAATHPSMEVWRRRMADQRGDPEFAAFRDRVTGAMERIVAAHPSGTAAVACHGGVVNAYLTAILGVPDVLVFDVAYTSVSRVRASRAGRRSVRSVNETGHLRFAPAAPA